MSERRRYKPITPPEELYEDEIIQRLNNILEYTHGRTKGHTLVALRGINEFYAKAVSNKKGEYYFAFSPQRHRGGEFLQIVTVFKRIDPKLPPLWDIFGNAVGNVETVDTMREETGAEWVQGFYREAVAHHFTKPAVEPSKARVPERRRRP